MSNPTWQNVLTSVLNRSALQVSIPKTVPVDVTFADQPWKYVEDRVSKLEEEIGVLQDSVEELKTKVVDLESAHQNSWRIILIFIDLRLEFLTNQPTAKLLRACGIEDPAALSGQDPKALHERMESMNKKRRLIGSVPRVGQVELWTRAVELAAQWAPSWGQSGAADS